MTFAPRAEEPTVTALDYAASMLQRGASYQAAARCSGLSEQTLRTALPNRPAPHRRPPAIRPVVAGDLEKVIEGLSEAELRRVVVMATARLSNLEPPSPPAPYAETERILAEVADKHGLTLGDLTGRRVFHRIAHARHEAMWRIARERPHLSLPAIGKLFNRDHTTVIHALRAHERRLQEAGT